jgi:DNA-binding NtrC family response regulator
MPGSKSSAKISILGLEAPLAQELADALSANQCEVELSSSVAKAGAEMVFCGAEPSVFRKVRRLNPKLPIVVVSRLPKVSDWLDALEAGAADYCAAPFEKIQIRWLVDTHLRGRRSMAAA